MLTPMSRLGLDRGLDELHHLFVETSKDLRSQWNPFVFLGLISWRHVPKEPGQRGQLTYFLHGLYELHTRSKDLDNTVSYADPEDYRGVLRRDMRAEAFGNVLIEVLRRRVDAHTYEN